MSIDASVIEQAPVPGISFAAGTPDATSRSSSAMRSLAAIELASLVVPKIARPSAPSSSSQRQNATKRPASGSPAGVNGVRTGTRTPANGCGMLFQLLYEAPPPDLVRGSTNNIRLFMGGRVKPGQSGNWGLGQGPTPSAGFCPW